VGDVSGAADVTWFGGDEFEESPSHFLEAGDQFVASRTRGAVTVPVIYDVETGEARELDFPAGVANVTEGRLADDRLLAYRTTSSRRPELVAYDLASDATETVLDAEYGPFAPDDFVEPETVSFVRLRRRSETPAAGSRSRPYGVRDRGTAVRLRPPPSPLIVNPHGGPRHRDSRQFSYRVQFLRARLLGAASELPRLHRARPRVRRGAVRRLGRRRAGRRGDRRRARPQRIRLARRGSRRRLRRLLRRLLGKLADGPVPRPVRRWDRVGRRERSVRHVREHDAALPDGADGEEPRRARRERGALPRAQSRDPRREPRRAPPDRPRRERSAGVPVSQPEFFGTRSTTPASRRASTTSTRSSARRATVPATSTRRSGRWNCSTTSSTSTAGSAERTAVASLDD